MYRYRYGRDHQITVDIQRYDNSALKERVLAELVRLSDLAPVDTDSSPPAKRSSRDAENSRIAANMNKRKKTNRKDNEIKGALALMELARN